MFKAYTFLQASAHMQLSIEDAPTTMSEVYSDWKTKQS